MTVARTILALGVGAAVLVGCRGTLGGNGVTPQADSGVNAAAGALGFTSLGPTHMSDGFPASGKVNAVAVDPKNAKIVYVGSGRGTGLETYSSAGLLKTTDGGSTWKTLTNGLVDSDGLTVSVINALWIDAAQPSVLLAASEYDGIYRSSDSGASWSNVFNGGQATAFASYGGALFATDDAGLLTSADDGKTWSVQLKGTKKNHPTALAAVDSSKGKAFYTGTSAGDIYAYASGKWSKVSRLPFTKQTGTSGSSRMVHQMTVDPFAPSTLYVSSNDGSWDQNLFASTNGGKHWTAVLRGIYYNYGLGTQAIGFSAVHQHRLYVGEDGGFYYITGDGSADPPLNGAANLKVIDVRNVWPTANGSDDACFVASDQGLDYTPTCSSGNYTDSIVTASAATGLARRFVVSPNGKTLMVSIQDFDSHRSTDGGKTWMLTNFYEDGFNELRPGHANACYVYDEASGLSVSSNGCLTFSHANSDITPSRLMTTPIAFDPKNTKTMYFASGPNKAPGIYGPKGMFKTTDGGSTIAQLSWPFTWPGSVTVDPKNGAHILVCDINNNKSSLSVTTNGGKTWKKSAGAIATAFWYAFTISPVNGKTVLASSVDAKNDVFVLRSSDGGLTFQKVSTVVNAPLVRGPAKLERDLVRHRGARRRDEDEDRSPEGAFVYSPEREIRYNQDVSKGTPDVAITTLRGAYLSKDNGSTWTRLDGGLIAHSFWGIRWLNGFLYLGSDGQGVVRSNAALQK
ncbi:MAG TPA: hypothetical protein VHX17_08680 [Candidatus Cybelea sp.]|nr:hypothetical protein [Candidatus Cybelea sp.]